MPAGRTFGPDPYPARLKGKIVGNYHHIAARQLIKTQSRRNRLTAAIHIVLRLQKQLAHIEADFNAFAEGAPRQDDVTFFVLTKD